MPDRASFDWESHVRDRLPALQVSPEREGDIIRELAQQLEQIYSDAVAGGAPESEAQRLAEAHFPDWNALAREIDSAERRAAPAMPSGDGARPFSGIRKDLQHAARMLVHNPRFAAIAIFTLAFGIGANTAIFTIANTVVFHPLPYAQPEQLVTVETRKVREPELEPWTSAPDLFNLRERARLFSAIAGVSPVWTLVLTGHGAAERLESLFVSADFFPMLGVKPTLGRGFLPEEDQGAHGAKVVVLSHAFWQKYLGGSSSVLGQKLILDGGAYSVVGVLPAGFRYVGEPLTRTATDIDIWLPLADNPLITAGRSLRFLKAIGRVKPGASVSQAAQEIRHAGAGLATAYPDTNRGFEMEVQSLAGQVSGRIRPALYLLACAVGFVLLMACANVANLLLAKTAARQKEIAIRVALGASPARLLRQLFIEGLMLAVSGGIAGVLLARAVLQIVVAASPAGILRLEAIALDGSALAFTSGAVLLSALLSTIPVGWAVLRSEIGDSLKEHGRGLAARSRRFRSALIVTQMALALVLAIGSGLLIRSFVRLLGVNPGFQAQNLATLSTQLPQSASSPERRAAIYRAIVERVSAVPGVHSVGAVSRLPFMAQTITSWLTIEGRQFSIDEKPEVEYRVATPSYFPTMGIPLIEGRWFEERDDSNPGAVVVINAAAARRFWASEDPIGKRVKFGSNPGKAGWTTIIGVVGDIRHFGLDTQPRPEAYRPYAWSALNSPILVVRTGRDPRSMLGELQAAIRSVNPEMPAYNVFAMEDIIAQSTSERRFVMLLLTGFGAAALFLAAVGIYGVVSQSVVQRTQEIGLRLAVGASPGNVQGMVLRDGLQLTAAGAVIGLLAAAACARLMTSLLFGVRPLDLLVFAIAPLVLAAVALLACWAPAARATRVDPLVALRHE